jgi:hypothetical protein
VPLELLELLELVDDDAEEDELLGPVSPDELETLEDWVLLLPLSSHAIALKANDVVSMSNENRFDELEYANRRGMAGSSHASRHVPNPHCMIRAIGECCPKASHHAQKSGQ